MLSRLPTIREETARQRAESARAIWWRKNVMRMTVGELSLATGFSKRAISYLEAGCTSRGRPIGARAWLRWKLACRGLQAKRGGW